MRLFARLYAELDETTRTAEKQAALERYFREAPPADAAWALCVFLGRSVKRAITSTQLRDAAARHAGLPLWLVEECHTAVGDLGETLALILPEPKQPREIALHALIEERLIPMRRMNEASREEAMRETWDQLAPEQRLALHKLLSGTFRVGISKAMMVRALARVAGTSTEEMAARVMGDIEPKEETVRALLAPADEGREVGGAGGDGGRGVMRPYPFFLAQQLEVEASVLGPIEDWQAEWKWDGMRAQVIRRGGRGVIWSRGEELIADRFPEIVASAEDLPDGTVLDGELLAWDDVRGRPLPFVHLQTRITAGRREATLFDDVPIRFVAYDLLEWGGVDQRGRALSERRAMLESVVGPVAGARLGVSEIIAAGSWDALARLREESRERGVEGVMLKRRDSVYGVGRTRGRRERDAGVDDAADGALTQAPSGDWWKWKVNPFTIDTVMVAAQPGHGRRAGLFTDYTFALWSGDTRGSGELVVVTKAYSGLTDEEIAQVDRWVRKNSTGSFGPVHTVKPEQVFEIAFEGVAHSTRHKAGLALRFPRMARWRTDKAPAEADTLGALRAFLPADAPSAGAKRRRSGR